MREAEECGVIEGVALALAPAGCSAQALLLMLGLEFVVGRASPFSHGDSTTRSLRRVVALPHRNLGRKGRPPSCTLRNLLLHTNTVAFPTLPTREGTPIAEQLMRPSLPPHAGTRATVTLRAALKYQKVR